MPEIKLFVSCHKEYFVPQNRLLYPVQVGAALVEQRYPGMAWDDTGDEISNKNRSYCELTAQYWAWKNVQADYFGFFHYRRYLSFQTPPVPLAALGKSPPKPYYSRRFPSAQVMNKAGYGDPQRLEAFIESADVIAPIPERMYISAYQHYERAPYHHIQDLELAVKILKDQYPEFETAARAYLRGDCMYFGNIFVMKKELFFHYNQWLFSILDEYDALKNVTGYSPQALRVDGYLAERLLGIYLTWLAGQGGKIACAPRIHFECMENSKGYIKKRIRNFLLPPGSRRRYRIKSLVHK